jgi:hypothetical protein
MDFSQRIIQADDVMLREVEAEAVLLNLATEDYFSLNEVGTQMFLTLCKSSTIQQAFEELLELYDVDADVLKNDLQALINTLLSQELVHLV